MLFNAKKYPKPKFWVNEMRQLLILPGRVQPSTFSAIELNFCVRDGNRWILNAIATAMVI